MSAVPYMAIASIAADLMSKKDEEKRWKVANLGQIEQSRLGDFKQIVQGGRATHEYGQLGRPKESSGLGAALQAIGSVAGSFGGGDSESGAPATNLEKPGLLSDWDPDAAKAGAYDKWKDSAPSLITMDVKDAPSDLDEALDHGPLSLGSMDPTPEKLTDDPDATSGFNDTLADKLAQKHYGMGKGRFGI